MSAVSPFWLGPRWPGDDGSCSCLYYGRGLSETRVPSPTCPVHKLTADANEHNREHRGKHGAVVT